MTITRRPPRPTASPAAPLAPTRRKKTPESFIEDAHHPLPVAETPTQAALPEPAVDEEHSSKKAKVKGKSKDKEKSKGKHKAEKTEKAKRKDKEAVLIRFEDEQLAEMDLRAAALGLSRAAWLRMVVSKALRGKKA
jgi:predicted DNA binding CopG/RHH family protein